MPSTELQGILQELSGTPLDAQGAARALADAVAAQTSAYVPVDGNVGFYGATPVAQPTAVANAAGGTIIDIEARAALNALLARLRTLGVIAT